MDRGTERDAPPRRGTGDGAPPGPAETESADTGLTETGRVPLAVVVVDGAGLVSHWSSGARRLFGVPREEAVGEPAIDLLPVSGALPDIDDHPPYDDHAPHDGFGPGPGDSLDRGPAHPAAGRARLTVPERPGAEPRPAGWERKRVDVLWWAYPLVGPGGERLLVLAADAEGLRRPGRDDGPRVERIAPGFALHTDFPGAEDLARGLPEILPNMSVEDSARIVAQVLELGYPILEFSQNDRVPVTPDWGVARRVERRARRERAARAAAAGRPVPEDPDDEGEDIEHAAVRERLEFLNEVSGRIGTSLDLSRTIGEVSRAVVPRFSDVACTYLREQVLAGEEFPDGVPDATTMWHRVALEHTDEPGRWDDVVPVGEAMPFPEHTPFFQCMTSGEPVLVPRIGERMGHAVASQFDKRDLRPLITGRSMLVVPLKARHAVLGFMVLLRHPERAEFDDMDRVTGAELAARAGLVLDNARMYTHQESVAETLQDSMPPHTLPRMAGCDIATC